MKILIAIESSNNSKKLANTTLRWAARAGFNMRVFIPDATQLPVYKTALIEANYKWYLDLPDTVLEVLEPKQFALKKGYDLIVYLPDDMLKWDNKKTHDLNVIEYAKDLGAARLRFGKSPRMRELWFPNGAIMERV